VNLRKKAIGGVKWTTISTITLASVGLIKISVLARYLDPSDFGLMALVTFVLGIMNLFMDMGLTSAILHKQNITQHQYSSLYWINIIFSITLFFIIFLISPFIAIFYEESELSVLIQLMGYSILLSALGRQFKTIEEKHLNFKYVGIVDIFGSLCGLVAGILLAIWGYGVYALVYAALIQYGISNLIYFTKGLLNRGVLFHFNFNETKPFLRIGIYQVGGQVVNYFNRDLDILLIGKYFGSDILGGYSLAKQLVQRPMQILNPVITRVASPVLALMQNNMSELKRNFLYFLNIVATANFTAYSLLAIFAYPVVLVLYGEDFTEIVILVQLLSFYMFLRSVGSPVGSLVIATGKTNLEFYWNLLVLIVMPVAILISVSFSIEIVALTLCIITLLIKVPFWRLLVYKLCGASLLEFLNSYIPRWKKLYHILKK
jgi:O-antigen/teichoic acid export membrane protein